MINNEIVALCKSNGGEIRNSVYRFVNKEGEIIYIGKAKNLRSRLDSHNHLVSECYGKVEEIHYTVFETEDDMELAERYLISRIKPKYNEIFKNKEITIYIDEFNSLIWNKYEKNNKKNINNNFSDLTPKQSKELLEKRREEEMKEGYIKELEDNYLKDRDTKIEIEALNKISHLDEVRNIIEEKHSLINDLLKRREIIKIGLMQIDIGYEKFKKLPRWKQDLYCEYLSTDDEYIIKNKLDTVVNKVFKYLINEVEEDGSFEVSKIYHEISKYFSTIGGYGERWLCLIDEFVYERERFLSQGEVEGVQKYCETVYKKLLIKLQIERNKKIVEEVVYKEKQVFVTSNVKLKQPVLIIKLK